MLVGRLLLVNDNGTLMDRKERIDDLFVAVKAAAEGVLPSIWTAMPGIIESVNLDANTCEVQPSIQVKVYDKTGAGAFKTLPLCVDVPLQFIGGGGYSITFPMEKGDEGLIVFACRCIDAWWQQGGIQPQAEMRMHDLSDGFFIPGFRSQPKKLTNVSASKPQLRSDDGLVYIELDKVAQRVNMVALNGLWVNNIKVTVP